MPTKSKSKYQKDQDDKKYSKKPKKSKYSGSSSSRRSRGGGFVSRRRRIFYIALIYVIMMIIDCYVYEKTGLGLYDKIVYEAKKIYNPDNENDLIHEHNNSTKSMNPEIDASEGSILGFWGQKLGFEIFLTEIRSFTLGSNLFHISRTTA